MLKVTEPIGGRARIWGQPISQLNIYIVTAYYCVVEWVAQPERGLWILKCIRQWLERLKGYSGTL